MTLPPLILLDIEGTVSPLAFVHEVMFPYARQAAPAYLAAQAQSPALHAVLAQMARDTGAPDFAAWCPHPWPSQQAQEFVLAAIHRWMDADAKITGLKQLQGMIWASGFTGGPLRAPLFADVAPALRGWHAAGHTLRVYSSGSMAAQQLFFAHTTEGDLTPLLSGYADTTTGPKRVAASYTAIAAAAGVSPADILFLSDIVEELDAARAAGLHTTLLLRPGNKPVPAHSHATATSFAELPVRVS